jgi:hydrogenase expression/formation protein HypC
MCIAFPGRVIELDGPDAIVEIEGRRRRASLLVVPDASPGDWVLLGAGTVLRRLDHAEALEIAQTLAAATGTVRPAMTTTGEPR